MTLYLRPCKFLTMPNTKIDEGSVYLIKILVDKIERRIYKISSEHIRQIHFSIQEQFITLSSAEYIIEVKLYKEDQFRNHNIIAEAKLGKQEIIQEKRLQSEPSNTSVMYDAQLNPLQQSNNQKIDKMTKDLSTCTIQLQIKFDKYKKVAGRLKSDTGFIRELTSLDEDLNQSQRQNFTYASRPRPSVLKKDQMFPNPDPSTKKETTNEKVLDNNMKNKIQENYIGTCYSKNFFSFLDRDNCQHVYSFVQP